VPNGDKLQKNVKIRLQGVATQPFEVSELEILPFSAVF
jgi:hypothetical protein